MMNYFEFQKKIKRVRMDTVKRLASVQVENIRKRKQKQGENK